MANAIIVDASVWLAVILQEEDSESLKNVLEKSTLLAPELIKCETANGILSACRRSPTHLKKSSLDHYFKFIHEFPIQLLPLDLWWNASVSFVKRHALTFYDAAYLGAAQALKIPLLTKDTELLSVMEVENVKLAQFLERLYPKIVAWHLSYFALYFPWDRSSFWLGGYPSWIPNLDYH